MRLQALLCVLGLAALAVPTSSQASYTLYGSGCAGTGTGLGAGHVAPGIYAASFAGSDNAIPFWSPTTKYQQLFTGSEFQSAFTVAGLGLRHNENPIVEIDSALVSVEIRMGYSSRTPATMSSVFADNFDLGAPVVVLPQTLMQFPKQPSLAGTDPSVFALTLPFATNFAYTPAPGKNLLIQITQSGASMPGYAYIMDAGGSPNIARLFGSPDTALSGTRETGYGLVMSLIEQTHTAVPQLTSKEKPQIGNDFPVKLAQAKPATTAVLLFGSSDTNWSGYALPLDLAIFGAPGCSLLSSVQLMSPAAVNASGAAQHIYTIPLALSLLDAHFYNQWVVLDPLANAWGLVLSNAGAGVIGN